MVIALVINNAINYAFCASQLPIWSAATCSDSIIEKAPVIRNHDRMSHFLAITAMGAGGYLHHSRGHSIRPRI